MTSPPERLRLELERLRDRDYPFRAAWPAAVSVALRDEPAGQRVFWRRTWNEQKQVFTCAYSRVAWPKNMTPTLYTPDMDSSQPVERTRPFSAAA